MKLASSPSFPLRKICDPGYKYETRFQGVGRYACISVVSDILRSSDVAASPFPLVDEDPLALADA